MSVDRSRSVPGVRETVTAAAWAAVGFGFLEGVLLAWTRGIPTLHAAHKLSAHVLWAAPLIDLPLFILFAVCLRGLLLVLPTRYRHLSRPVVYGALAALGTVVVALATDVLHTAAIGILGAGVGTAVGRALARRTESGQSPTLPRVAWLPIPVLGVAVGVMVAGRLSERVAADRLADASEPKVNVLVLLLDTVRHDLLAGDSGRRLAPNLTRLAERGTRFASAWASSSWSLPSHASILTGRSAADHGADWSDLALAPAATTLAEFLEARGYVTGVFSGNASWITPEYLGRGVLRFHTYEVEDFIRRTVLGRGLDGLLRVVSVYAAGRGRKAPDLHADLLRFLDDYPDRPFFAYLCYMDVNQALYAARYNRYFRRIASVEETYEAYEEGLHRLDSAIGDLLAVLDRQGVLSHTLIIVASDHGESFGEGHRRDRDPGGHGTSLYPEQLRVPLFVIPPGSADGMTVERAVSLRGVAGTVARYLTGSQGPFPGAALPLGGSPARAGPEELVTASLRYRGRDLRAAVMQNWLAIMDCAPTAERRIELIDLASSRTKPLEELTPAERSATPALQVWMHSGAVCDSGA